MLGWLRRRRRKRLLQKPWPDEWYEILARNVRHYQRLDPTMRERFRKCIRIIVEEKTWEGLDGLEITDEIKVTIAGQAAVMLLGSDEYYFDGVRSFLVFPRSFRRKTRDGWVVEEEGRMSGEAWQGGPIVLSWRDVLSNSKRGRNGHNLVVHELAHHLDGIDGEMGGSLTFRNRSLNDQWQRVLEFELASLQDAANQGRPTILDHYGATNEAEFFAVASESFFELPKKLKQEHEDLFEVLVQYYRLNPINWQRIE